MNNFTIGLLMTLGVCVVMSLVIYFTTRRCVVKSGKVSAKYTMSAVAESVTGELTKIFTMTALTISAKKKWRRTHTSTYVVSLETYNSIDVGDVYASTEKDELIHYF